MTGAPAGRGQNPPAGTPAEGLYQRLVRSSGDQRAELDSQAAGSVPANGLRLIGAEAWQATGDQLVNARTVLPWLFTALGVPAAFVGLLVPIREAGSLLPQAVLLPWIKRRTYRRRTWIAGALSQAACAAAMAVAAATLSGAIAGVVLLGLLALFACSRALTSLAGKDVLGRTIPAGQRGQINGLATVVAGAAAITVGLAVRVFAGEDAWLLVWLLAAGTVLWVAAAVTFRGVSEPAAEPEHDPSAGQWSRRMWELLRDDAPFRRFVTVRGLLLVSALSPPFVVAVAADAGQGMSSLGQFVIASGVASLIGGQAFGRWADRSSRGLMAVMALASSIVIAAYLVVEQLGAADGFGLFGTVVFLLLALAHTGARVGRKTYVVDMADADQRTEYVAVANSAMGLILLAAGAVTAGLAAWGPQAALAALAVLGLGGAAAAMRLPQVSVG